MKSIIKKRKSSSAASYRNHVLRTGDFQFTNPAFKKLLPNGITRSAAIQITGAPASGRTYIQVRMLMDILCTNKSSTWGTRNSARVVLVFQEPPLQIVKFGLGVLNTQFRYTYKKLLKLMKRNGWLLHFSKMEDFEKSPYVQVDNLLGTLAEQGVKVDMCFIGMEEYQFDKLLSYGHPTSDIIERCKDVGVLSSVITTSGNKSNTDFHLPKDVKSLFLSDVVIWSKKTPKPGKFKLTLLRSRRDRTDTESLI